MSAPINYKDVHGLLVSDFQEKAAYLAKVKTAQDRLEAAEKQTKGELQQLLQRAGISVSQGIKVLGVGTVTLSKGKKSTSWDESMLQMTLLEAGVPAATIAKAIESAKKESTGAPFVVLTREKPATEEKEAA
jgi:hypothetical protein